MNFWKLQCFAAAFSRRFSSRLLLRQKALVY
jgi:hypothetical protein